MLHANTYSKELMPEVVMKKLILIVFTLMIANITYAGENASTECIDSDQRSRSAEPIVVNSSSQTESPEEQSTGTQQ